jgi:hypothetical protein
MGTRAGHVDDGSGPVPVVLGVVGGVDGVVDVGIGSTEGDLPLDPAGADAPGAAGKRVAIPRSLRSAGGPHVDVVADADDPHRRGGARRPIRATRSQLVEDHVADGSGAAAH